MGGIDKSKGIPRGMYKRIETRVGGIFGGMKRSFLGV
jgi:hypothetical protein